MTDFYELTEQGIIRKTKEEALDFFNDPKYVHFVGMYIPPRPGVRLCFTKLEHTYYAPGTNLNKFFLMHRVDWEGIVWMITSIPETDRNLMEKVAAETELRIADGVPHMFSFGGEKIFPVENKKIYTLENTSNHPVYGNDPKKIQKILEQEDKKIDEIIENTARRMENEVKKSGKK